MASSANNLDGSATGQERFGRFYLQELLNSGGMADIWLVTDGRNKPYALRKLKRDSGSVSLPSAGSNSDAKFSPN